MQELVEEGKTEFILGTPPAINKTYNAHRDTMIHKLEPRLNLYARKLREMYFREGSLPQ